MVRGKIEHAPVVLASATPSVESWVNAAQGRYARLDLRARYGAGAAFLNAFDDSSAN